MTIAADIPTTTLKDHVYWYPPPWQMHSDPAKIEIRVRRFAQTWQIGCTVAMVLAFTVGSWCFIALVLGETLFAWVFVSVVAAMGILGIAGVLVVQWGMGADGPYLSIDLASGEVQLPRMQIKLKCTDIVQIQGLHGRRPRSAVAELNLVVRDTERGFKRIAVCGVSGDNCRDEIAALGSEIAARTGIPFVMSEANDADA